MTDFLSVVQLATDQDSGDDDDDSPRVTLMTVHAAKGLEFRNVIIVGVEDEMFPSMHSSNSLAEVEEEPPSALCGDNARTRALPDDLRHIALHQRTDA